VSSDRAVPGAAEPPVQKFGTFLGVYTPSVLTILGLIMYLRFGWVVGNVGLGLTILIVLLSSTITFITGLSASAIATNMRVGVGGEYYMISRSLGLELGGAIGIPLFLCRTLSITFYCFGLAESIFSFMPLSWRTSSPYAIQLFTAAIIIFISIISGKSAGMALKLQIPIMAAVGLSVVALTIGVFSGNLHAPEWVPTYRTAPEGFWYVFAVFFPAVTGFTAGIGMSGDLKDPRRSIPRGTMLAVITGTLMYLFIPVLLAITTRVSFSEMAEPGIVWLKIAVLGAWLVYPGLWGAILSSAFGSVLGGPRVLQALASDGLAPAILARLSKTGQPVIATAVSGTIALMAVALGGLNAVAQFVTILFLTLYVIINFSAGIEKLVRDPSYRPTINVPWFVSFLGSLGAIALMFMINPIACIAAMIIETALYLYLRHRSMQKRWGDVRAGMWVAVARFALLKLKRHSSDPRNWRPHILLFSQRMENHVSLTRLACWFNQNRGVVTVCRLLQGNPGDANPDVEPTQKELDRSLEEAGLIAFSEVDVVSDFEKGVMDIAQANGIAGLQSNTVMFSWPKQHDHLVSRLRIMRALSNSGKSTIIARINWAHEPGQDKRIAIWWGGLQNNGDLMLLLAYLLSLNSEWKNAKIFIRSIATSEEEYNNQVTALTNFIPETRIHAETEVILKPADQSIEQVINEKSQGVDVVFLGLKEPEPGAESEYADKLTNMVKGLSTIIFVRNAGKFAGRLI
jgi:amino acid transporter